MEVEYLEIMRQEDREELNKLFIYCMDRWGKLPAEETSIVPGNTVLITWACGWNKPHDIGEIGLVLMGTNKHCIVQIGDKVEKGKPRLGFYRCEDLKLTKGKITAK